jgi:hypothetical protein
MGFNYNVGGKEMKILHVVFASLLLFLLSSCATEEKSPLEGVWELASGQYTTPDTTIRITPADWTQIKVITKSHHVWIGQAPNREKFTEGGTDSELLAAARTFGAGGGTYTIEGDKYIEHIKFFLNPNYVNASIPFTYKMEGDQWIQSGTFPAKSLGLEEYDTELYEVWKRVE